MLTASAFEINFGGSGAVCGSAGWSDAPKSRTGKQANCLMNLVTQTFYVDVGVSKNEALTRE